MSQPSSGPSTADAILAWMRDQAEKKVPIEPLKWLEAGMKLNILSSDENDRLIELEMAVAALRMSHMEKSGTAAAAKVMVEASEEYADMRRQQAKVKRIEEAIRMAKKYAQIRSDELRSGL